MYYAERYRLFFSCRRKARGEVHILLAKCDFSINYKKKNSFSILHT